MAELETPVLIVGGSLVGMTAAMLLAQRGIRPLVVESHRGTAIHPRAALINQRTMEIFREAGIETPVALKSEEQFQQDGAVVGVESLAGRELATYIANLNEGIRDASPCRRLFVTQRALEPVLRDAAERAGAELRFYTRLESFEQDETGIRAVIRDRETGQSETVRARYMIAADGARSLVRERLGIEMRGRGTFSNSVTIYFRADVAPLLRGRNLSIIMVTNSVLNGFFRFEKPYRSGFLAVHAVGDPERPETDVAAGLTEARALELLHAALGDPEIEIEIENIMPWSAEADVADRFQDGRVLLAGDAAHVMPPYGGFGGNTGVHDAHNLAWKLALVLEGRAGEGLLSTYHPERHPIAAFTVEQAFSRYVARAARYLSWMGPHPAEPDLNIELGYAYRSDAILAEGPDAGFTHGDPRRSRGRPGRRAPHLWLERDGERISTLDLFGREFVLLASEDAHGWCEAAARASAELDVPIRVVRIGAGGAAADPERQLPDAYGLGRSGAALVRPDGFVAWRATDASTTASGDLTLVLRRLLSRTEHS